MVSWRGQRVLPSRCLLNDGPCFRAYSVQQYDDHVIVNCCGLISGTLFSEFFRRDSGKSRRTTRIARIAGLKKGISPSDAGASNIERLVRMSLVATTVKDRVP